MRRKQITISLIQAGNVGVLGVARPPAKAVNWIDNFCMKLYRVAPKK